MNIKYAKKMIENIEKSKRKDSPEMIAIRKSAAVGCSMLPINKIKEAREMYNRSVSIYIEEFCKKQEMDFEFWVADLIGEVACFGEDFFNFSDIKYDLENNCEKGLIVEWSNANLDNQDKYINYSSYHKGLRHEKNKQ